MECKYFICIAKHLSLWECAYAVIIECIVYVSLCIVAICHQQRWGNALRNITRYVISNQKQPSCKKRYGPHKGHGEKRCEIQGGGQEMAMMVG